MLFPNTGMRGEHFSALKIATKVPQKQVEISEAARRAYIFASTWINIQQSFRCVQRQREEEARICVAFFFKPSTVSECRDVFNGKT